MTRKFYLRNKLFLFDVIALMILFIMACGDNNNNLYSISGTVSGDPTAIGNGVLIDLTGAATSDVATDENGNYIFTGLANGTYILTPSLMGYTFNPVSTVFVVSQGDGTANFVATAFSDSTWSISGTVTGTVQTGVLITLSGNTTTGTTMTDANGYYSFANLANGGTYIVTPSLTGYTFTPGNSGDITILSADVQCNFTSP